MYLLTHAYFCLYHALSNILIRRTLRATAHWGAACSKAAAGAVIFGLAYATAFMETFTISQVRSLLPIKALTPRVFVLMP